MSAPHRVLFCIQDEALATQLRELLNGFPEHFSSGRRSWKPVWRSQADEKDVLLSDCVVLDRVWDAEAFLRREGPLAHLPVILIGAEHFNNLKGNHRDQIVEVLAREDVTAGALASVLRSCISEAEALQKLAYLSVRHAQKRLLGRSAFFDLLEKVSAASKRTSEKYCVMAVKIQPPAGHAELGVDSAGAFDKTLVQRLTAALDGADCATRGGGDVFLVLCAEFREDVEVGAIAEKFLEQLGEPLKLAGKTVVPDIRIGISICEGGDCDGEEMIAEARAKMSSLLSGQYQITNNQVAETVQRRRLLKIALASAVEREEFSLHYQPIFNLESRKIRGGEALLRWRDRRYGEVSPEYFIPLAEENETILQISYWTLTALCKRIQQWRQAGICPPRISVNVSEKYLCGGKIVEDFRKLLEVDSQLTEFLEFEMTERIFYHNIESSQVILEELKEMGARVALDDFGTGQSSLTHLYDLPVDTIKLDRSFVSGLPDNNRSVAITRGVMGMAREMGKSVVAEGIETESQCRFLRENGCELGQGYLFCRPLPAERFMLMCGMRDRAESNQVEMSG